ncbi:hypothetical protein ACFQW6_22225 [Nocardioides sp. GCM10028917]|uniref:hypothetical protein n=1 Tax=Nocardioides sp. GCM10028917 TaxID=3273408 RepID=UPI00360AD0DE
MNHLRNTVAVVAVTAALSLVAACGDVEPPANDITKSVKKSKSPAPKMPVRDHANRLDFGDGEATLPAKPKPTRDINLARLDFGDHGRP